MCCSRPNIVNPQHATFLNVTFGSSFDADDTHVGAMLHPGVATWAAAFAVAEHVGGSGPEVLAAVVAGYEVTIRIGLAVQPGHFKRGFQSTGTCDGFGTAAAAGRLLFSGTDARQKIADALGLAGGYASGLAQFYYSGDQPSAFTRRMPLKAASPLPFLQRRVTAGRTTLLRGRAALPVPMPATGIEP